MTAFPWSVWWDTVNGGDLRPLFVVIALQAGYYLSGIIRMTLGYGPWHEEVPTDDPFPNS